MTGLLQRVCEDSLLSQRSWQGEVGRPLSLADTLRYQQHLSFSLWSQGLSLCISPHGLLRQVTIVFQGSSELNRKMGSLLLCSSDAAVTEQLSLKGTEKRSDVRAREGKH